MILPANVSQWCSVYKSKIKGLKLCILDSPWGHILLSPTSSFPFSPNTTPEKSELIFFYVKLGERELT